MFIPLKFVYVVGLLPLAAIWTVLVLLRRDLRKEIFVMSFLIGLVSLATLYYWYTVDWWRPPTLTGTRLGIEDFFVGFFPGGIMAAIYEVIFKKRLYKRKSYNSRGGLTVLVLLACVTAWLIWIGFTSFWASTISMIVLSILMLLHRKDLFSDAIGSGLLMLVASLPFYYTIIFLNPEWIKITYLPALSGKTITGIPVEELVFWFLAGFLWGPFYEFWQGERLRKIPKLS